MGVAKGSRGLRVFCVATALVVTVHGKASAGWVVDPNDADRFDIRKVTFVRMKPDGPAVLHIRFFEGFRSRALDGRLNSEVTEPDLVLLGFRSMWGYLAGSAYIRWIESRGELVACFYHPDDPDFVYPRIAVGHPERDLLRLKLPPGLLPYGKNRVQVKSYRWDTAPWVWSTPTTA
jgi:hypothetical protein